MTGQSQSLRERLEGKTRRRITVPILIENPEPLQEELNAASAALAAAAVNDVTPDELHALQVREDEARQALAGAVVDVEFQALEPAVFEALVAEHTLPDPTEGAVVNSGALLPILAAHCAVDQSLRDEEWWIEQLQRQEWTSAEKSNLYLHLFNRLHYAIPSGTLGKG